jgi:hypothetical protein
MEFLDSSIVIYFVEQPQAWGLKASARLGALRASAVPFATSGPCWRTSTPFSPRSTS